MPRYSRRKRQTPKEETSTDKLGKSLQTNIAQFKQTLGDSTDIVIRNFKAGQTGSMDIAVLYTSGLVNEAIVHDFVLDTLMVQIRQTPLDTIEKQDYQIIKDFAMTGGNITDIDTMGKLFDHVLSGDTVVMLDGSIQAMAIDTRDWESRGVEEPSTQSVVRGPKEGFTETLRTNTALMRRRIKDENLWIRTKPIGKKSKTDVAVVYLNGVADEKVVKEVYHRLDKINIDAILDSGYVEELIQDETYTPFPTVYNSERPDTIAAGILEGKIAIIVDGSPFVLLVPALFVNFFQAAEDYFQRADFSTLIRMVRYLAFFLAMLTPSVYIALTTYHQEMIPTSLLVSLSAQREGVPFPAFVEALLMEITFEILREAGVRLPKAVGSAISIVGALVLGQAAVEAGIVSSAMVIVVSLTAISSFVSPSFSFAISIRMLRFGFMILAATLGLFGILLGLIILTLHLSSLRSFGVPYLSPMAPFIVADQKDAILRFPRWKLTTRPRLISQQKITRENGEAPKPPKRSRRKKRKKQE
ncbi:spore germination protein [Thalassobacillus devorans]|uniref:spore germination protein n=1 Tax=Thalassobacillus devorans TaxID=279813 RepID=UPI0004B2CE6B|nr:spore germination protein [Thalassobacillus devorans]